MDFVKVFTLSQSFEGEIDSYYWYLQKQPLAGAPKKRCSENMDQIYWRTPMLKCDFKKVALQLNWNYTSAWVFSCKFAAYFQSTFSLEPL